MISILPAAAWREFRGEPKKKGLNKTTHMAVIADPSGKLHHCYVKGCPPGWPTPLTEAMGWLLAEELDLPRPEFAALVLVPLDKLRKHMDMDQHWLHYPDMLAFCASAVDGKTISDGWQWSAHLRTSRVFRRPEVARISAFDSWVDNQDRNTGNLIVKRNGDCVPIDNEFILYSLLWNGKFPFAVGHKSLLDEGSKYLKPEAFDRFKLDVAHQSQLHDAALQLAGKKLKLAVHSLVGNPTDANAIWTAVDQFLTGRADPAWLPNQLGVIV